MGPCTDSALPPVTLCQDFFHDEEEWGGVGEVDLVLTTGEVLEMVQQAMGQGEGQDDEQRAKQWFAALAQQGHADDHDDDDAMDTVGTHTETEPLTPII